MGCIAVRWSAYSERHVEGEFGSRDIHDYDAHGCEITVSPNADFKTLYEEAVKFVFKQRVLESTGKLETQERHAMGCRFHPFQMNRIGVPCYYCRVWQSNGWRRLTDRGLPLEEGQKPERMAMACKQCCDALENRGQAALTTGIDSIFGERSQRWHKIWRVLPQRCPKDMHEGRRIGKCQCVDICGACACDECLILLM